MEWTPSEIGDLVGTYTLGAFLVIATFFVVVRFINTPPKWFDNYLDRKAKALEREASAQETIAESTKAIHATLVETREQQRQSDQKIDHLTIEVGKSTAWFEQWGELVQELVRHYLHGKHNEPHPKAGESES